MISRSKNVIIYCAQKRREKEVFTLSASSNAQSDKYPFPSKVTFLHIGIDDWWLFSDMALVACRVEEISGNYEVELPWGQQVPKEEEEGH